MSDYNNNLIESKKSFPIINHNQTKIILQDIIKDNRKPIMFHSNSMDNILKNDDNWAEGINRYYSNKKILKWGVNPKPTIIKDKYVKSQDLVFNPITQKYRDKKFEDELKNKEETNLKESITKSYDNELRVIQTFDIINLKDRLELLKNHPNYPKNYLKQDNLRRFNKLNISSGERNYNILSNIDLNLHHYDKPENRPLINQSTNNIKRLKNANYFQYKDYDIISNKYKNFDKEKKDIDNKISMIESSKKYFNTRDYDAIQGIYVDKEKEQKYQDELKAKLEKIKNRKRDSVFNPFNNQIFDKEKYEELNRKMKNKIYRYSLKPKIENFYHLENMKQDILKSNSLRTKIIYNRFKEIDKRGYDIINGNDNFNHYKNSISCRNIERPWDLIKEGVNENQTIKDKKLYICYDAEDVNQRFKNNKIERKNMLQNLPKIEDEKIFHIHKPIHKIKENLLRRNNSEIYNKRYEISENNINSFNIDKGLWFSSVKNINFK